MKKWVVCDESDQRPGFCCLSIRDAESTRLIADLADEPIEFSDCKRPWAEAKLIAAAPELLELLTRMLDATNGIEGQVKILRNEAYKLIDQLQIDE
ncbi:MAG: hypothetical protein ACRC2T_20010 [Thermoguttaceae bacterium]